MCNDSASYYKSASYLIGPTLLHSRQGQIASMSPLKFSLQRLQSINRTGRQGH